MPNTGVSYLYVGIQKISCTTKYHALYFVSRSTPSYLSENDIRRPGNLCATHDAQFAVEPLSENNADPLRTHQRVAKNRTAVTSGARCTV